MYVHYSEKENGGGTRLPEREREREREREPARGERPNSLAWLEFVSKYVLRYESVLGGVTLGGLYWRILHTFSVHHDVLHWTRYMI